MPTQNLNENAATSSMGAKNIVSKPSGESSGASVSKYISVGSLKYFSDTPAPVKSGGACRSASENRGEVIISNCNCQMLRCLQSFCFKYSKKKKVGTSPGNVDQNLRIEAILLPRYFYYTVILRLTYQHKFIFAI